MSLITLAVAVVVAAVLVAAATSTPAQAESTVPGGGIVLAGNTDEQLRQIDIAAATGVQWVFFIEGWREYEGAPDAYLPGGRDATQWSVLGEKLARAKSKGLRTMVVFKGTPPWARPASAAGDPNAPPDPAHYPSYAAFMGAVAADHGAKIDAYGTWSEPNIQNFWSNPDPAAYAALHLQAAAAVTAADPTASIVLGPFAGGFSDALDYLRAVYANGVRGTADVIGWNVYPVGAPERFAASGESRTEGLTGLFALAGAVRAVDPGRKAWITEIGWSTCQSCGTANVVTPTVQADYLLRTFSYQRRYLRPFVDRVFWYNLADGKDPTRWQSNQGLVRADLSPKPSYSAMLGSTRLLAPPRALRSRAQKGDAVIQMRRLTSRRGTITGTVRLVLPDGGRVSIEGWWRGRWREVSSGTGRSGLLRLKVADQGYRALRLRARTGGGSIAAGRIVPDGPALTSTAGSRG